MYVIWCTYRKIAMFSIFLKLMWWPPEEKTYRKIAYQQRNATRDHILFQVAHLASFTASSPLHDKSSYQNAKLHHPVIIKLCEGQQSCYYLVQEYQNTVKGVSRQMLQGQQCILLHSFCGYPHHVSVRKIWTVRWMKVLRVWEEEDQTVYTFWCNKTTLQWTRIFIP